MALVSNQTPQQIQIQQAQMQQAQLQGGGRFPASISQSMISEIEASCSLTPMEHHTTAETVVFKGKLCTKTSDQVTIHNKSTKFKHIAQISDDHNSYEASQPIPLRGGKNELILEFHMNSGKVVTREITVHRQ